MLGNKLMTSGGVLLLAANMAASYPAQAQSTDNAPAASYSSEAVSGGERETYERIRASLIGDADDMRGRWVVIDSRNTAEGMLGRAVYNSRLERVGTLSDIIVDSEGKATMAVISDGEFPGFSGKLAAFNYNVITSLDADGDVIAPISENDIDEAVEFSYEPEIGQNQRTVPAGSYSVEQLLEGQILNARGENIADIDNIVFQNGQARMLVAGFDKTLGMGGKIAAVDYDDARLVRNDDSSLDFQLDEQRSASFETYRRTASN